MIFGLTEQIFGLPNIELDLKSGLRIKSLVYRTLLPPWQWWPQASLHVPRQAWCAEAPTHYNLHTITPTAFEEVHLD